MGLNKHGKKKCVVYEDGIPTTHLDGVLLNGVLVYTCRMCGELVKPIVGARVPDRRSLIEGQ